MARTSKRKRKTADGTTDETTVGGELDEGSYEEEAPSLGGAIELVRNALAPFDDATRKKVIRAAGFLLK